MNNSNSIIDLSINSDLVSGDHLQACEIKMLSNANLISCFDKLVRSERKITMQILLFICEIDKRRLYLIKAYTSLFEYLVKDFGYSPSAAMRRIDGARLLSELPEISEKLKNGSITLSQATQIQRAVRETKKINNVCMSTSVKRELVLKVENLTQKETEKTISLELDLPILKTQKEIIHKDESVTLMITLSSEQMAVLKQAQDIISHSVPNKNWSETIMYLAKNEIKRRAISSAESDKSIESKQKNINSKDSVRAHVSPYRQDNLDRGAIRKAIPTKVRRKLLHPKARCEYLSSGGERCLSTRFLQIDHIHSWSRGGEHLESNFQVLCGVHNRCKYQLEKKKI